MNVNPIQLINMIKNGQNPQQLMMNILGNGYMHNLVSVAISIIVAAIVYFVLVFALHIMNREDIILLPSGARIYRLLVKLRIYKD